MKIRSVVAALVVVTSLAALEASAQSAPASDVRPSLIRFDATLAQFTDQVRPHCTKLDTRQMQRPFIVLREIVKVRQMQIDCDGFQYGGKPRWAEFVFADDTLAMVWILTDSTDEATLLRQMTLAYGEPTHRNEKFIAFANDGIALRTDRPEVLFFAPHLKANIVPWFETPSTFR